MTNVSLSGLLIDPQCLGKEMLSTGVRPYFSYMNNKRTDTIEGHKYETVLPGYQFAKLDIKVPGSKRLEVPDGEFVAARFDGLEAKLYFDNSNRIQLTAKACRRNQFGCIHAKAGSPNSSWPDKV